MVLHPPADRGARLGGRADRADRDPLRRRQRLQRQLPPVGDAELRRGEPARAQRAESIGGHRAGRDRGRSGPDHRSGGPLPGRVDPRRAGPSAARLGGLLALRAARRVADLAVGAGRVRQRHVRRPGQQDHRRRSQGVRQRRARRRGRGRRRRGRGPGRRGGQPARCRRPSVRDPRRRDRPVHRVRLAAGDAAAARDRRPVARHRRRRDRPALARDPDGLVHQRARAVDRPRGRRRLRAVHRHPLPPGAAARTQRRGRGGRVPRHLGSRRAVRRDDRVHRDARHVRARGELPVRRRGRHLDRGRVHGHRLAHAAAGHARVLRHARIAPQRTPRAQGRARSAPATSRRGGRAGPA